MTEERTIRAADAAASGHPGATGFRRIGAMLKPLGCLAVPLFVVAPFVLLPAAAAVLFGVFFGPYALVVAAYHNIAVACVVFIAAAAVHLASTHLYGRQVRAIMQRRSGTDQRDDMPALDSGTEHTTSNDTPRPGEPDASGDIRFITHGREAETLVDTPAERFIRDRLHNRRGRTFLAGVLAGLAVNCVLSLLVWTVFLPGMTGTTTGGASPSGDWIASARAILASLVPTLAAVAVILLMYRQRLGIGIPTAVFAGISVNMLNVLMVILDNAASGAEAVTSSEALLLLLPIGGYFAAVVTGSLVALRQGRGYAEPGLTGQRLLVLRVFGVDRNTASLFGFIVRRWPFLGPTVTIVDPSYAKLAFSRSRLLLLLFVSLPPLLWVAYVPVPSMAWMATVTILAYYTCYLPLLLAFTVWRLRTTSGRTMAALRKRMAFETSGIFRRRFASIRLACFDDLWKSTMAEMVNWADAVLMDLRGFDASRAGCEFEIAFLMNHCPLARIVFLTDATTDMALFHTTMRRQSRALRSDSPNKGCNDLVAHIFATQSTGRGLRGEMLPLLALMGELITSEAAGHATKSSAPAAARHDAGDPITKRISFGIAGSWGLVGLGMLFQLWFQWDGLRVGSGLSVIWLGGIALMLTTRMRRVLIREGHLARLFRDWWWSLAFFFMTVGWLLWYAWIPLMN